MRDVVWSSEAWALYQNHLERLRHDVGLDIAIRSRDRIEEAVEALARRPLIGRPSQRWPNRREKSLLSDHKIILYSHDEFNLRIIYLADSRQDLDVIQVLTE